LFEMVDIVKKKIGRFCAFQERCSREVELKLKEWDTPPAEIPGIIRQLKEEQFLDDERFAMAYVRGKLLIKRWGRIKTGHGLREKGIPESIILKAFEEIDEDKYREILRLAILKKWKEIKHKKNLTIREKLINFALTKGFEFDLIIQTLNELKL